MSPPLADSGPALEVGRRVQLHVLRSQDRDAFLAMSVIPERSTPEEISAQVATDVTRWKSFLAAHKITAE